MAAPSPRVEDEAVYIKEYNDRVIKRLEDKMLELEGVNSLPQRSEKKNRELVENADYPITGVERTGYISFVNPKSYEITGYSIDEAKKLHVRKLIHPDGLGMATECFRKRLAG